MNQVTGAYGRNGVAQRSKRQLPEEKSAPAAESQFVGEMET
jgi:hypothetical protein